MHATPELVYVDNEDVSDPRVNLALEEYVLRYFDRRYTYVLFYVNEPSLIIGRNQNTVDEINLPYVQARGIHVVRRLSGGGAVYHDAGNLNFSFVTDYRPDRLNNFRFFTEPVVRVLRSLGVAAELQGRNDLVVSGRKISGNAQFASAGRMFSHGTLLFNSDLGEVVNALNVKKSKIQAKGIQSVRQRVANIAEYAEREMSVPLLRKRILEGIFEGTGVRRYRLSTQDWQGVEEIVAQRYGRADWNFGSKPRFNVQRVQRFTFGEIDARIEVEREHIQDIHLTGDFMVAAGAQRVEHALRGKVYDPEVTQKALAGLDWQTSFPGLSAASLRELLHR
ncbi:lipoate--protein ligase [bacterium]|nr:MAG: lipoate--protein ligase [bacterium]